MTESTPENTSILSPVSHEDPQKKTSITATATPPTSTSIEQAIKFWHSPALAGVNPDDKLVYLKSKGLGEADIHQMWDQIMMEGPAIGSPSVQPQHGLVPQQTQPLSPPNPYTYTHTSSRLPQQQVYPAQYPEERNSTVSPQIPALLTVGGFLGLAAAASVRWLNGGDFSLLPPPTKGKDIIVEEQSHRMELQEEDHIDDDEDEDEVSEKLKDLSDLLKASFSKQESLLQRLVGKSSKDLTDKSMALLMDDKTGDAEHHKQMNSRLVDLYDRMDDIKQQLDGSLALEMDALLDKLDGCIKLNDKQLPGKEAVLSSAPAMVKPKPSNSSSTPAKGKSMTAMTDTLSAAIGQLALENDTVALKAGAQLLYLYVLNLSSHPHVPRYRKIFTSNDSFQKVETLIGGKELLLAVDFVQESNTLVWTPGEHEEQSVQKLKDAAAALSILKLGNMDQDKTVVANLALAALSSDPTEHIQSNLVVGEPNLHLCPGPQTPQPNVLVSPPANKRNATLESPTNFPGAPETPTLNATIENATVNGFIVAEDPSLSPPIMEEATRLFVSPMGGRPGVHFLPVGPTSVDSNE